MTELITPVVLCGGSGSRLWPLSRASRPKQLLALEGAKTMLELTIERVSDRDAFTAPILVAADASDDGLGTSYQRHLPDGGLLIIEPVRRNTAAAVALAALAIHPAQLMLVMPSDHLIADVPAFLNACRSATPLAQAGRLITFGIRPDRAEPGFGYIKRGVAITDRAFSVARFVEKPDRATASRYLQSGNYEWNAGIFLFTAGFYLEELGHWSPGILQAAKEAMDCADRKGQVLRPARNGLERCKGGSIDKAVLEHSDSVAVLPVEIGWSDVGTYDALYETGEHDGDANVLHGPSLTLDTQGCLIRSEGPLITAIGVHDLIVIATGDVVLITKRGASDRLPELVARIEQNAPNLL